MNCHQFKCFCGRNFTFQRHLSYHLRKDHNYDVAIKYLECAICHFKGVKTALFDHFENQHDLEIKSSKLQFETFELFECWKKTTEKDTCACFVKSSGSRTVNGKSLQNIRVNHFSYLETKKKRLSTQFFHQP